MSGWELFVERETDGLDGNVWGAALLEERSEDSRWDISTSTDGDHELWLEVCEDALGRLLTELMHLCTRLHQQGANDVADGDPNIPGCK